MRRARTKTNETIRLWVGLRTRGLVGFNPLIGHDTVYVSDVSRVRAATDDVWPDDLVTRRFRRLSKRNHRTNVRLIHWPCIRFSNVFLMYNFLHPRRRPHTTHLCLLFFSAPLLFFNLIIFQSAASRPVHRRFSSVII